MQGNPLVRLGVLGQSVWLDYISRDLITSGALRRLIEEREISGMTSNPAIFEKVISDGKVYDEDARELARQGHAADAIYDNLSQRDVREAADHFRPLYDATHGKDGYVSLEVDPHLAHDVDATLREARRLWESLHRMNILIKVPATDEGLIAFRQLLREGINVNVTLLFGLQRYRQVAESYVEALEERLFLGKSVRQLDSVASFFISRIDLLVDSLLGKIIAQGGFDAETAKKVRGQTAIACGKMAYQVHKDVFGSERFKKLMPQGGKVQRLLWASTGTKDPSYSDVKYVEALIGPDTITTLPMETLDAYRDHGVPQVCLEQDLQEARSVLERLPELGIQLSRVTRQLEDEGLEKFAKPYDNLMALIRTKSSNDEKGN
jgi:transaldolase